MAFTGTDNGRDSLRKKKKERPNSLLNGVHVTRYLKIPVKPKLVLTES